MNVTETFEPILGTLLLVILAALIAPARSRWTLLFLGLLLSFFVLPRTLLGSSPLDGIHVGIAAPSIRLMTYTAIAALGTLVLLFTRRRPPAGALVVLPLFLFVSYATAFVWPEQSEITSGAAHLLTGCLAWVVGCAMGRDLFVTPEGRKRVAVAIGVLLAFQTLVMFLQYFGMPLFSGYGAVVEDRGLSGRVGGSLGHPSTIGKVVFLLGAVLLALSGDDNKRTRVVALTSLTLGTIPLVLSGGRANAVAFLSMWVLFVALDTSHRRWGGRLRVMYGSLAVGALTFDRWAARFATGEDGTYRKRFNAVAMELLEESNRWTGVGPNRFVEAAGHLDPLVAQGWLVHNFFYLGASELGYVGVTVISLPFAYAAAIGWRSSRRASPHTPSALFGRALVSMIPGLLLILVTGWGMMGSLYPGWMWVTGLLVGGVKSHANDRAMPPPADAGVSKNRLAY